MNNHILTHTTTRKATTRCCSMLTLASLLLGCSVPKPEYGSVDEYPVPMETINELTYEARQSTFQLWSPNADSVKVHPNYWVVDKPCLPSGFTTKKSVICLTVYCPIWDFVPYDIYNYTQFQSKTLRPNQLVV